MEIDEIDSKFDLTIYIYQKANGLYLELAYNADLFDKPRMQDLLQQYVMLIEQVVADPNQVAWQLFADNRQAQKLSFLIQFSP
jgi:hypothetical protein